MKKTNIIITIAAVLIALFAANYLASRHPVRVDLTDKKIYTLSDSTKKILKGLDDVVTIRAYFTQNPPPAIAPVKRDVDDVLSEFKRAGGSKVNIEHLDPAASPQDEQKTMMMGIPPIQLNVVEKDKAEVAKIYMGLAILFGGKQQVLPVIQDLGNLEYDLAEAVVKVSSKENAKVGWLEPQTLDLPNGEGFSLIKEALSKRYDLTVIADKNIADLTVEKFPVLVAASPRELSEGAQFAVDQYLMNGGKIIALADRIETGQTLAIKKIESPFFGMMENYGATVEDSIIVDPVSAMAAFSGGGPFTVRMLYPFWPDMTKDQLDRTEPIVAGIESLVLPWTSPLKLKEGLESAKILGRSSKFATTAQTENLKLDPDFAKQQLAAGAKGGHDLIALLTGPFTSYFANDDKAQKKSATFLKQSANGARIILVGSSHWLTDKLLSQFPQDAVFFQNALDSFSTGDLLIGIRSRGNISRPLAMLEDGPRTFIKYANVASGPAFVMLLALFLFLLRRRSRRIAKTLYI